MPFGRHGIGQVLLDVPLGEEELALQIVVFDEVPVDDAQPAGAGPGQRACDHGPQRPAADHDHEGFTQPALPVHPDAREDGLA